MEAAPNGLGMLHLFFGVTKDKFLMEELDIIRQNENLISIMDMVSDLNISDHKWDFIFDYLVERTNTAYFEGFRKWVRDPDNLKIIDTVSEKVLVVKDEGHVILIKLKWSTVMLNRAMLNTLWEMYEYTRLIFLVMEENESKLIPITAHLPGRIAQHTSLQGIYVVERKSAPDVLWLSKSPDMEFPWETSRSPLVEEREQNRSLLGRLLDFFRMDVKINGKKL